MKDALGPSEIRPPTTPGIRGDTSSLPAKSPQLPDTGRTPSTIDGISLPRREMPSGNPVLETRATNVPPVRASALGDVPAPDPVDPPQPPHADLPTPSELGTPPAGGERVVFDAHSVGASHQEISDAPRQEVPTTEFDDIADTAILSAGQRTVANIPHAREVLEAAARNSPDTAYPPETIGERTEHVPDAEAAYLVTRDLINENGNGVFEIASGLSTHWAELPPGTKYVGFDLPTMSNLEQKVFADVPALREFLAANPNVRFEAGNALDEASIMNAVEANFAPGEPVTVVSRGLLHYLNPTERAQLANNIGRILDRAGGGVWITDMPSKEGITERDQVIAQPTSQQTGRDVAGMRFETNAAASEFFAQQGLVEVERRPFMSVIGDMQSPQALNMSPEAVKAKVGPWSLWVFDRPGELATDLGSELVATLSTELKSATEDAIEAGQDPDAIRRHMDAKIGELKRQIDDQD